MPLFAFVLKIIILFSLILGLRNDLIVSFPPSQVIVDFVKKLVSNCHSDFDFLGLVQAILTLVYHGKDLRKLEKSLALWVVLELVIEVDHVINNVVANLWNF
jgi:hypothetical protein